MNILFITHYTALYGANKSLLNLLEGIREYDVNVLIVIPAHGDFCEALEKRNIPYIIQPFGWWCGNKPKLPKSGLSRIKAKVKDWKLKQFHKKNNLKNITILKHKSDNFKPDFVYSNSAVFNFGFLFSKRFHIPHIWHLREIQEHYDFKWFYNIDIINRHFRKSEIVLAISNFVKKRYEENNKIKNIIVEYDGVLSYKDLLLLDEKRENKIHSSNIGIVFGIIGLIHPNKGQEDAIRAFSIVNEQYPDSRLLIAGWGEQMPLKKLIEELNMTNKVSILGHISDPFQVFLEMDVCLMCSKMEGLGRVTLEAMASNIPVIGNKEGGTIEIIQENITGLFYEKDHKQLAEKMIYLIENKEQRIKMGDKGREIFEQKYTTEIYAERFLKILNTYKKKNL